MMMKRVISALVVIAATLCVQAQGVCVIKGRIASDTLRYDGQKIKKVYLTRLDEYNRLVNIDSTKVKKGKYSFQYKLAKDEPTMLYLITGFDNGNIPLFVEEGNVNITTASAAYPQGSEVSGTATNNLYAEYKKIYDACVQEQLDEVRSLTATRGEEWVNSDEGLEYRSQFNARSILKCNNRRLEFLLGHNASPLAPLMMNHELLKHIGNTYAMQMVGAIDHVLHSHPYYRAFKNEALAGDLREGNELPDIPLQMQDGSIIHLSDFTEKDTLPQGTVLILGYFDGVHKGHRALITEAASIAAGLGGRETCAWTFDSMPKAHAKSLTTTEEKCRLFAECGVDYVILEDFESLKSLGGRDFFTRCIADKFAPAAVAKLTTYFEL